MSTSTDEAPSELDEPPGRRPPQSLPAEREVLGSLMLNPAMLIEVLGAGLTGRDFYRPAHQLVWDAICHLDGESKPTDGGAVREELQRRGDLTRIGGDGYLHTLLAAPSTALNAGYHASIVVKYAVHRRAVEAGTRIVQHGYGAADTDELVGLLEAEVLAVTDERTSKDITTLADIIEDTFGEIEAAGKRGSGLVGVPTGFADLDKLTNGFHPGQMIVIAARPAIGKSTLAVDIARSVAIRHGMTTAIFSLEMSRNEIMMRILSAETRVLLQNLRKGNVDEDGWAKLAAKMGDLTDAPLLIDDNASITMLDIRAKCRRLKQKHDLKLVIIDYLQLMSAGRRVENRQQEVSEISRAVKLMAKELEVPVIALSQLNRGPEQRSDKKPLMSDLRESGSLEQDSDVVILLHREDAYDKESPRAGEADLIVAKHRNGPTDTITVAFQGHYSRFVDMAASADQKRTWSPTSALEGHP